MTITAKLGSSFKGNSFAPNTLSYARANNIYSSSTYNDTKDPKGPNFRNLNPSEILQPSSIEDIIWVVKTATKMGKPLAIRSGGHQYSGASSTGPQGIQIDLQPTFRRPNVDLNILRENGKVYLRSSVSWKLTEIFDFLKDNGVFMPTGQCSTVCLGGHVQTGGYGMLARSFGLLGDWVRELEIVDYKGDVLKVTKDSHPDLFFGFLGGSPGNLGVLTHFKIEVQDDNNHVGSKGMWAGFGYSEETLKTLLDLLVKKGEDPKFPRGYDFTVNIVSRQANLLDLFPGTEDELKKKLPDRIHDGKDNIADLLKFKYAMIVVYAQWVNLHEEPYSDDLFNQIKNVPNEFKIIKEAPEKTPMSYIASMWLFASPREFPYPYDKRTNSTASTQLSKTGWSSWFASRVNEVIKDKNNGLWVSSQLQVYGGEQSMFRRNKGNGTAYTFRDATFSGTWDVFFQGTREAAAKWQDENDKGRAKYFSKEDRRVLWGSYGDWDMKNVWQHYYDPETYRKVQKLRKTYDPNGTFTANPFCVEALK